MDQPFSEVKPHRLARPCIGGRPLPVQLVEAVAEVLQAGSPGELSDEPTAAAALRATLEGNSLVIHATAPRQVLDRLYDDLRRLGPVDILAGEGGFPVRGSFALGPEGLALLGLLAAGETLREAARQLHLSTRTADRWLARARATLGVATTAEVIRAIMR